MDERLSKIHSLIETIRSAENELDELIGGKKERKQLSCSVCGSNEHTARTCPTKVPAITL
jgi:hypothetical protein